jgi:hypothetical protein
VKYRHIIKIVEWKGIKQEEECEWLDDMSDQGWELISSQFLRHRESSDADHYLSSAEYAFRYVFRTPRKKQ